MDPVAPEESPKSLETHRARLVALAIYALTTALLFATTAPERLRGHTPYNHFALLADAWIHGRLDLAGPPPAYTGNNDFAFDGARWFISFPPFPAVLIAPLVMLTGSAERDTALAGVGREQGVDAVVELGDRRFQVSGVVQG